MYGKGKKDKMKRQFLNKLSYLNLKCTSLKKKN